MQRAPAGALPFPRFHATVYDHMLCAGQTTDSGSVVSGRSLLYAQPRLSRTTARSSPVLWRVVDASVEGPLVVLV